MKTSEFWGFIIVIKMSEENYKNKLLQLKEGMEKKHSRLQELRNQLNEDFNLLIDLYFNEVRTKYTDFDEEGRNFIESRLEHLIGELDQFEIKERKITKFDGILAKRVRASTGLSITQLVKNELKIDPNKGYDGAISCFERGKRIPHYPSKGKYLNRYLLWLKDHGYNPYNL